MMKLLALAALPVALGLTACSDSTPDAAGGTATAAAVTGDDALAADPSVIPPTDTNPTANPTDAMTPKQLDTTAESLEKQADAVEDTSEAEADRLEAQAKALQDKRDAQD